MEQYPNLKQDIGLILDRSDQSLVSAKMVRKQLAEVYPGLDVKAYKAEIDAITIALFQAREEASSSEEDKPLAKSRPAPAPAPSSSAPFQTYKIPKRERVTHLETDEEYARNLEKEEARGGRTSTRGDTNNVPKKGVWKKKSKVIDPNAPARKVSTTGFNKPHLLSEALAHVCGATHLSRPQVTKQLWVYIKEKGLQDPAKRTDILPDAALKKVLPFNRITSFKMAKEIGVHLFPYTPKAEAEE